MFSLYVVKCIQRFSWFHPRIFLYSIFSLLCDFDDYVLILKKAYQKCEGVVWHLMEIIENCR